MNKEQQIKEIIESVQKVANEALQKIKELEKEETNAWPWVPEIADKYYFVNGNGRISVNAHYNEFDKKWLTDVANRGLIAPGTEEGRKTLEKRDEWFRFMFKFMTAGDVEPNGWGHSFYASSPNSISEAYGGSLSMLGHNKFSTKRKFDDFIKSFGGGDYNKGIEYIRKMLKGGLM